MSSQPQADRSFAKALGPGLVFAGAAVGVSHLVQSTKAGALFGLSLLAFVLLANVFKYPAFQFGPRYAAATGTSLLEGYRRQGIWALILYTVLTLGTMLTVQAAVVLTTAGLLKALFGLDVSAVLLAGILTLVCGGLLALGRYPLLDKAIKVVVVILTLATFIATAMVIPKVDWGGAWFPSSSQWEPATFMLVAGLIGWMPSAIDISVWHSLWTLARREETGYHPSLRESLLDFNIGYIGTALLAFCFVLLGAGVMYGSGERIEAGAGAFAAQVIELYTSTLGDWSRPVIGIAAFAVMLSTSLTVIDGFPRALSRLWARYHKPEEPDEPANRHVYWASLAFIGVGSVIIIAAFLSALGPLVTLATILSFLTAPVLATLNHRAMVGPEVPDNFRLGKGMRRYSIAGIIFNAVVALAYVYLMIDL